MRGVPTNSVAGIVGGTGAGCARTATGGHILPEFTYAERIGICDAVLNVPHSGDVEQIILEAQACGTPVLHTDDGAIMADAVGRGGSWYRPLTLASGRSANGCTTWRRRPSAKP